MPVTPVSTQKLLLLASHQQQSLLASHQQQKESPDATFALALNKHAASNASTSNDHIQGSENIFVELGVLSKEAPTVSHLLKDNANFQGNYWNVIHDPINHNKPLTQLRTGTKISINVQTNEIVWSRFKDNGKHIAPNSADLTSTKDPQFDLYGTLKPEETIDLGRISKENPTVSHLLKNNKNIPGNYWNILYFPINQNKHLTELDIGTKVTINTNTNEIVWSQLEKTDENKMVAKSTDIPTINNVQSDQKTPHPTEKIIDLGAISKDHPTVSHLLKNNANIQGNFWNIIYDPINQNKPFQNLLPGTQTSINTRTNELYFNSTQIKKYEKVQSLQETSITTSKPALSKPNIIQPPSAQPPLDTPILTRQREDMSFSEKLADSIKPLIGRPYNEIDCYGLVVRGLINQGINYQGKGGLRQSLENAAKFKGLPGNAFLTGEGLIENSGTTLYSKTYLTISNSKKQANEIFAEMKNKLDTGHILSFSTPSRGHTGVIAKRDNVWTYINSGIMDNNVQKSSRVSRKVGEEILQEEIKNWCRLAKNNKESLSITMGRLDEEKLKIFSKNEKSEIQSRI